MSEFSDDMTISNWKYENNMILLFGYFLKIIKFPIVLCNIFDYISSLMIENNSPIISMTVHQERLRHRIHNNTYKYSPVISTSPTNINCRTL